MAKFYLTPSACPCRFEALEPRVLLSSDPVASQLDGAASVVALDAPIVQPAAIAGLDNNLQVVDLTDLDGNLPLDIISSTQILWQTEDWETPRWKNPNWPTPNGREQVGFSTMVKNDHGLNQDGKYYLFYSSHDPMSGIGVAVSDTVDGSYTKPTVPGRSDNLVVPSFQYDNVNWSPDSPDHTASPSVVWNEDEQLWFIYFHYFNHIRNIVPGFQLTAMATTPDLASHNWTIWIDASFGTTPPYRPVLPTTSDPWIDSQSSYHTIQRLPAALPGRPGEPWLAFMRGTSTVPGSLTTLGFATSADGRNWNYFPQNPVIHQNDGGGGWPGLYRTGFIGYLGGGQYLVAWNESPGGDVPHLIYGYTTDFVNITRDPRGHAGWANAGEFSAWREGDRLYLFSGKFVHEMVLPVTSQPPTRPGAISAPSVGRDQATITWGASTDADGDPISYRVQYRKNDLSEAWSPIFVAPTTTTTLTDLEWNTSYRVRVRADDGTDVSPWRQANNLFTTSAAIVWPYVETFDDDNADFFQSVSGTWTINAANRYKGTPVVDQNAVSLVQRIDPLPAAVELKATIKAKDVSGFSQNGLLVYDYQNADNFKFAGFFVGLGEWRIGRWFNGAVEVKARVDDTIAVETDYDVEVQLRDRKTTLLVGGVEKLSFEFGGSVVDGDVGVGTRNAVAVFDDFVVRVPAAALPYSEDFEDNHADFLTVSSDT